MELPLKGPLVYVAGPYTKTDPAVNTHIAIEYANKVLGIGGVPFIPHLSHLWHLITPKPYTFWLEYDLRWMLLCHAILRIPGESSGADKEVNMALRYTNIQVFTSVSELEDWIKTWQKLTGEAK